MSTSPISKKSSRRPAATTVIQPLPNDVASLRARAEKRRRFDFERMSLEVRNHASNGKQFERSFAAQVDAFPHHQLLIKQLLQGAQLDLGNRSVAYQTHQECYYGIEDFIAFLNTSGQPHHKIIFCVADIDFQTTRNFASYLLQNHPGRTANRKRYGRLKTLIEKLKKRYEGDSSVGETIAWAQSPSYADTPSESYPDHVFDQLVEASLTDVKFVMKMMNSYPNELLEAQAFISGINSVRVNRDGIINGASREQSNRLASALASNSVPQWPLYCTFADANNLFSNEWYKELSKRDKRRPIYRALTKMPILHTIKDQGKGSFKTLAFEVGQLAYFSQFFFTLKTLFPFIFHVQLNTGWNLESVLSLSDDLDSHLGEDIVDPEQHVIIYSTKLRTETFVCCRSNKRDPYSVYNVLRFVSAVISRFKDSPHYIPGNLWQGIAAKNLWQRFGYIVASVNSSNYAASARAFLARHGISLDTKGKYSGLESRRLRTTWETKRKEQGLPLESISPMMGHSDVDTTAVNYDSDSGSRRLIDKKIRRLQEQWQEDFRDYGVRLAMSITLTDLRKAIGNPRRKKIIRNIARELELEDERQVVTMLSPAGQTYIVACLDSNAPSWAGAERFIFKDERCVYFNRCCMCRQAVVFKESLPYIARRIVDLEQLKTSVNAFEWSNNYGEEVSAWEKILNDWNPIGEVEEAKALCVGEEFALPLTMKGPK